MMHIAPYVIPLVAVIGCVLSLGASAFSRATHRQPVDLVHLLVGVSVAACGYVSAGLVLTVVSALMLSERAKVESEATLAEKTTAALADAVVGGTAAFILAYAAHDLVRLLVRP